MKGINKLGYFAKDSDGNLHQFEWGANDEFYINNPLGSHLGNLGHFMMLANANDYEILEVGNFTADFDGDAKDIIQNLIDVVNTVTREPKSYWAMHDAEKFLSNNLVKSK